MRVSHIVSQTQESLISNAALVPSLSSGYLAESVLQTSLVSRMVLASSLWLVSFVNEAVGCKIIQNVITESRSGTKPPHSTITLPSAT